MSENQEPFTGPQKYASQQLIDTVKLCELFAKIARHVNTHDKCLSTGDPAKISSLFAPTGAELKKGEKVVVHSWISFDDPDNEDLVEINSPIAGTKQLFLVRPEGYYLMIMSSANDKLSSFEVNEGSEQQDDGGREIPKVEGINNKSSANRIIYYDTDRDGSLTLDRAHELVSVFAQALSRGSSFNLDEVMKLIEGPDVDDRTSERVTYDDRTMAVARRFVIGS
ncbi:MAG: hypothetical protein AAF988_01075 [Pseudomonadota bacterium]